MTVNKYTGNTTNGFRIAMREKRSGIRQKLIFWNDEEVIEYERNNDEKRLLYTFLGTITIQRQLF